MGLFGRFRKEKAAVDWGDAYTATPRVYGKSDGTAFGAIALTEGTKTILPKVPQKKYAVDGEPIAEWRMVLVSTTKDDIVADCDYFGALERLKQYVLDEKEDSILVAGLSLDELEGVKGAGAERLQARLKRNLWDFQDKK